MKLVPGVGVFGDQAQCLLFVLAALIIIGTSLVGAGSSLASRD